jgi:aminoglycoside phosphotransferase (APT) family kinase protein
MDDVARSLIADLQRTLDAPELAYAEPPVALTGGFDTAIYAFRLRGAAPEWSAPLVLRVYRLDARAEIARFEAAVHGCLAGLGMPVPRVLLVDDGANALGHPFVVMERAPGRNLVAAILSTSAVRVPRWLAETQAQLHGLPAVALERALASAGFDPKERRGDAVFGELARAIEEHGLEGLRAASSWLAQSRPPPRREVICHGDFHPLNLLADGGRVTALIDWPNVRIAEPSTTWAPRRLMGAGPGGSRAGEADRARRASCSRRLPLRVPAAPTARPHAAALLRGAAARDVPGRGRRAAAAELAGRGLGEAEPVAGRCGPAHIARRRR